MSFYKRLTAFVSIAVLAASELFCANYTQTLEVQFPDAQSAADATVSAKRLPDNAITAFSSRWDDTNAAHAKTAKAFKNAGLKATFLLTRADEKYIENYAKKFLADGFAIGSHTITHRILTTILPNDAFYEILGQRIKLETALDTPVVAFVLPGYFADHPFYPDAPKLIGELIVRAGYQIQTGLWADNDKKYGLPKGSLLGSHMFNINDREPSEKAFKDNTSYALYRQKTDGLPHMTLGVHSWQSDAGFAELERILKTNKRPDFWYCTQNEYAAYTRQFENFKLLEKKADGKSATFKIGRISATDIGDNIALEVKISGNPVKVKLDGTEIALDKNGNFALPQPPEYRVPQKIDTVENPHNDAKFVGQSAKFAGLSGALSKSPDGKLHLFLKNGGGAKIANCTATFRLPPLYAEGVKTLPIADIDGGKKIRRAVKLPAKSAFSECESGDFFFAVQLDFLLDGKPSRLYLTTTVEGKDAPTPSPRDTAVFVGPLEKQNLSDGDLQKLSAPAAPLAGFGQSPVQQWTPCKRDKNSREFQIAPNSDNPLWRKSANPLAYKNEYVRLAALDFSCDGESATLFADFKNINAAYLNGVKLDTPQKGTSLKIATKRGQNRLIIEYKQDFWTTVITPLTVSEQNDPFKSVKFDRPAAQK